MPLSSDDKCCIIRTGCSEGKFSHAAALIRFSAWCRWPATSVALFVAGRMGRAILMEKVEKKESNEGNLRLFDCERKGLPTCLMNELPGMAWRTFYLPEENRPTVTGFSFGIYLQKAERRPPLPMDFLMRRCSATKEWKRMRRPPLPSRHSSILSCMMSVFLQKRYFQHDKSFQTCNTLRGTAVQKGSSSLPDCKEYSMYLSIDS